MKVYKYDYRRLTKRIEEKYGSVESFAKEVGQAPDYVKKLISNNKSLELKTIDRWCRALDISQNEIHFYFFCVKN